jgi:ATP-dependent DNA helicase RecQ
VEKSLLRGDITLLYVAPERLNTPRFLALLDSLLERGQLALFAIDEAHCVSQWGHDFRPEYRSLAVLAERFPGVPRVALTATADALTRDDMVERLQLQSARTFISSFDRPNIRYQLVEKKDATAQLVRFIRDEHSSANGHDAGIVYCQSRRRVEEVAEMLNDAGFQAMAYHAGMDSQDRLTNQDRFLREEGWIMVATIAFGMGIDKPDIRWVAHADLPKSIEGYYQEIGRAGRDGAPAETLTLYGPDDIRLRRTQIDEGLAPPDRKAADHARLNALLGLAEAMACRRQVLLGYFGEEAQPCGTCDLCDRPAVLFDATDAVRKALSAILRTGEWFGAGHLIDILTGNATAKVREKGHDGLPTFGVGKDLSKPAWGAVFRQMMGRDLVRPDGDRFGALRMTDAARPILRGEANITLRRDTVEKARPGYTVKTQVADEDASLLSALKAKRRALAEAAGAPAYVIFPDRTLIEMAEKRPMTLDEMMGITGVGAKKLESYGALFLSVITGAESPALHPARKALVGRDAGALFDRLAEVQLTLSRGDDGTGKYLSCTHSTLRQIAERRPSTLGEMQAIQGMGDLKTDRFGTAFLEVLREG